MEITEYQENGMVIRKIRENGILIGKEEFPIPVELPPQPPQPTLEELKNENETLKTQLTQTNSDLASFIEFYFFMNPEQA